jgi:hypothetical protein
MTMISDPAPANNSSGLTPPPTVLRGPAHAENYRIKVGRYNERWYRDPLPGCRVAHATTVDEAYPSVSSVKGAAGKDWTYVTLKRVAMSDQLEAIAATGFYERYERLKVINQLDLSQAQRRGTNVHTRAESIAYGVPFPLGPRADGSIYFPVVDQFFADYQPELVAAEFVCIDRTLNGVGYGGTSDGIFDIGGKRYMVDWKSRGEDSAHGCYPEEAAQLAAYFGCEYVIVEDDDPANPHGAKRISVPDLDGALIVSIKPDSYEVYPVDMPLAIEHFHAMHAWWSARRTENKTVGHKWPPRRAVVEAEPETSPEPLLEQAERRNALYERHAEMTPAQQAEFAERIAEGFDTNDLDAVEQLIDSIVTTPRVIDMARARMVKDQEREADRQLSAEGGAADPDDVALFTARWELSMSQSAQQWTFDRITEANEAGVGFRLSELNSQRRADLINAITEWARGTDDDDPELDDDLFRTVLQSLAVENIGDTTTPLGVLVGRLTTETAATLRLAVTEIVEGRLAPSFDETGTVTWRSIETSES